MFIQEFEQSIQQDVGLPAQEYISIQNINKYNTPCYIQKFQMMCMISFMAAENSILGDHGECVLCTSV